MKRRTFKKKLKRKYNDMVDFLSSYCELPRKMIIDEYHYDLIQMARSKDKNSTEAFLDAMSIEIMAKHKSGWRWRDMSSRVRGYRGTSSLCAIKC